MPGFRFVIADDHPLFRGALKQALAEFDGEILEAGDFDTVKAMVSGEDDIDLVLLDVKSGLPETYRRVTGRDLQPTLDFGARVAEHGIETWVRFVLVPGLTDEVANVAAVADYVATLSTVTRVEVLPFHQMGRDKWASLGMAYELDDVQPPTPELVARVRGQFAERGLTVF